MELALTQKYTRSRKINLLNITLKNLGQVGINVTALSLHLPFLEEITDYSSVQVSTAFLASNETLFFLSIFRVTTIASSMQRYSLNILGVGWESDNQ